MLTIALVEDDPGQRAQIGALAEAFFRENGEETVLIPYADGAEIVEHYPRQPDLILMDIDMPRMSGLEAARQIRSFDREVLLIFITNLVQCALEGYAVEAMDFIAKPVTEGGCRLSFSRALRRLRQKRGHTLSLKSGKSVVAVSSSAILYGETQGREMLLHLADGGELTVSETIQNLERRTREMGFFRCHTSFLVNLSAVDAVGRTEASIRGVRVPVSKYRREDFLQAMASHRGGSF